MHEDNNSWIDHVVFCSNTIKMFHSIAEVLSMFREQVSKTSSVCLRQNCDLELWKVFGHYNTFYGLGYIWIPLKAMDEGGSQKIISIRTLNHFAIWNLPIQGLNSELYSSTLPFSSSCAHPYPSSMALSSSDSPDGLSKWDILHNYVLTGEILRNNAEKSVGIM